MSAPNQALAEALTNADDRISRRESLEASIQGMSNEIRSDTVARRGAAVAKYACTVSAMLSYSTDLRILASEKGVDLNQFDAIVARVQTIWQQHNIQPAPAKKIIAVLIKTPVQDPPF